MSIVSLIIRHWDDVNDTLNNAPDQNEPLIFERESDGRVLPIIDVSDITKASPLIERRGNH